METCGVGATCPTIDLDEPAGGSLTLARPLLPEETVRPRNLTKICLSLSACLAPRVAAAQAAPAANPAPVAAPAGEAGAASPSAASTPREDRWIRRHRPFRGMMELGVYGGLFFPRQHELYYPGNAYQPLRALNPDLGLRFAYFPLRVLGVEAEVGVMPSRTATTGDPATVITLRGHGILQAPYRIAPFLAVGYGMLAMSSKALGGDVDGAFQYGGGVKFYATPRVVLRLDLRANATSKVVVDSGRTHHLEALLGVGVVLGRRPEKRPEPQPQPQPTPTDRDGDTFLDVVDRCVDVPGIAPDGCPPGDRDGDTFVDPQDRCPDVPGVAPDGCPPPDRDGDGITDLADKCPDDRGPAPDGCPIIDSDGDGLMDPDDRCVQQPEVRNGFQDEDGCPDELPKEVAAFSGVIKGIYFDVGKDTIKDASRPTLDNAVQVLKDYPAIRLEISGHTDADGKREANLDLSRRRAESVKRYLVEHGIDAGRLETRGAGPDEPIADNKSKAGKAKNRRIEFMLIAK